MIALLLAVCVTFITGGTVQAAAAGVEDRAAVETEAEMQERVFEEVRSGEITNEKDVLKVALDQYEERLAQSRARSSSAEQEEVNDSLSIAQVVGRYLDETGDMVEGVVTTGLVVMDENQKLVTASDLYTPGASAQLSEYSVYCTMNVNYDLVNQNVSHAVRLNWFDTRLVYGTQMTAKKLLQDSKIKLDVVNEIDDIEKVISNPKATTYRYVPGNKDRVELKGFAARSCRSVVWAGSRSVFMGLNITHLSPYGDDWRIEYDYQ